jgi:hypothetical protein
VNTMSFAKPLRSSALALVLSVGAVGASLVMPMTAQAAAVEVQTLPKEVADPADVIGRGLASKADQQLKAEVGTYARQNMFGITGDLIPSGEVTFSRAGLCTIDGRKGAVLEFDVHARAKVDVGSRKFGVSIVRKVWAVDTVQKIQIVLLPKQKDDGSVVAEVRAEIVSASATPERQAKQSDADGFRDKVSNALRDKLSAYTGDVDARAMQLFE